MRLKTLIAGVAGVAMLAGTALMPVDALAQRGGHGGGGHISGMHRGGGFRGFHPGGRIGGFGFRGSRGFRGGYGGWGGVYPWWGFGVYAWPYYYGPSCGYVRVRYYRHHRRYWRWIYVCRQRRSICRGVNRYIFSGHLAGRRSAGQRPHISAAMA